MLSNEWFKAAESAVYEFYRGPRAKSTGWKTAFQSMTDEGGSAAAQVLYQANSMNKVLSARTSAERHLQLALWVLEASNNTKRFARLRAFKWRQILKERLASLDAGARMGFLTPIV